MFLPLKDGPSIAAFVPIPLPANSLSPGIPNFLGVVPFASIIFGA